MDSAPTEREIARQTVETVGMLGMRFSSYSSFLSKVHPLSSMLGHSDQWIQCKQTASKGLSHGLQRKGLNERRPLSPRKPHP